MALLYEKRGYIAYLTINRPEVHNSVDPETAVELASAWQAYKEDEELRCAIITGAGDKSFCSGMDLARLIPLSTGGRTPETEADHAVLNDPRILEAAMLRNFELYKPVIAAINGYAIAGGMELIQSTDIRIASESAQFGLQEVKWALFPLGGSTVRLSRQVPFCKAMEILLTGDLFDAQEALRIGFVNRVVPMNKVMEEAEKVALRIIKNGPLSVTAIKKSVIQNIGLTIKEGLEREKMFAEPVIKSKDAREGPRAFKEKREPKYIGE